MPIARDSSHSFDILKQLWVAEKLFCLDVSEIVFNLCELIHEPQTSIDIFVSKKVLDLRETFINWGLRMPFVAPGRVERLWMSEIC
jgi:hypothetical protein